jgi:hypothetical protein
MLVQRFLDSPGAEGSDALVDRESVLQSVLAFAVGCRPGGRRGRFLPGRVLPPAVCNTNRMPVGDCHDGLWGQVAVWPPNLVRVACGARGASALSPLVAAGSHDLFWGRAIVPPR